MNQAANACRDLLTEISEDVAHSSHSRFGGLVSRRLAQIRLFQSDDLFGTVQDRPTGPQLDELLCVRFETEHFDLYLICRPLVSFPWVSYDSIGLKQD